MVILIINWSIEITNSLIAAFIMIISIFIMLREYIKVKHRFHLFLIMIWILLFSYMVLSCVGLLFQSIGLFKLGILLLIPSAFLLLYILDSVHHGSLDPFKMLIFGITSTGTIYSSFLPDSIKSITLKSGSSSFKTYGAFHIWLIIFTFGILALFFFYCLLIFIKSPKSLKKKALITLIGGIFFTMFSYISFITRLNKIIPGILYIFIAVGAFIISLSFALEPQLLNVLISSAGEAKAKLVGKILPICAHCKKIKDEEGNWHQIEKYFSDHSKLLFSHGLCPECLKEYYSDI